MKSFLRVPKFRARSPILKNFPKRRSYIFSERAMNVQQPTATNQSFLVLPHESFGPKTKPKNSPLILPNHPLPAHEYCILDESSGRKIEIEYLNQCMVVAFKGTDKDGIVKFGAMHYYPARKKDPEDQKKSAAVFEEFISKISGFRNLEFRVFENDSMQDSIEACAVEAKNLCRTIIFDKIRSLTNSQVPMSKHLVSGVIDSNLDAKSKNNFFHSLINALFGETKAFSVS